MAQCSMIMIVNRRQPDHQPAVCPDFTIILRAIKCFYSGPCSMRSVHVICCLLWFFEADMFSPEGSLIFNSRTLRFIVNYSLLFTTSPELNYWAISRSWMTVRFAHVIHVESKIKEAPLASVKVGTSTEIKGRQIKGVLFNTVMCNFEF